MVSYRFLNSTDHFGWIPGDDRPIWNIAGDNTTGTDNGTFTDSYATKNGGITAD